MTPYLWLGMGCLWLGSLAGAYHHGQLMERGQWETSQNAALRTANAQIKQLEDDARASEQRHANDVATVSAQFEKEKRDVAAQKDFVIAGLRSGGIRLRDPGAVSASLGQPGSAPASPGECDGAARGGLSETTSEFLVDLANDADQVVAQLAACQAVVVDDRKE